MPGMNDLPVTQWHINNVDMVLYKDFDIVFVYDNKMWEITIKEGFTFDGASIPKFLWDKLGSPYVGEYRIPALVHDAFYKCADRSKYSQDISDKIFEYLMEQFNEHWFTDELMYQAVDKFGKEAWDKNTENLQPSYITIKTREV